MTFREVLQIEIWSKRTTRKIWLGFGLVVMVLIGVATWVAVSRMWLTASERRVGKVALVQVDALQRFAGMGDLEYIARYKDAEVKVATARQVAWTERDHWTAEMLSTYLMFTDIRRVGQKRRLEMAESDNVRIRKYAESQMPPADARSTSELLSLELHDALR